MGLSASDIKYLRSLQQKKFRKEHEVFVVEGVKMVNELIRSSFSLKQLYYTEPFDGLEGVNSNLGHLISTKELGRISSLKNANRTLAIAKMPSPKTIDWTQNLILMLDGIGDPGNLGTIIRTAKWFGVSTIVCSEDCADVFNPKTIQSTMGALFHVQVFHQNLIETVKEASKNGYDTIGATMDGCSLFTYKPKEKTILIIGSESHGIRPELVGMCSTCVTIPNTESDQKIESLNASIATALILSELTRNFN